MNFATPACHPLSPSNTPPLIPSLSSQQGGSAGPSLQLQAGYPRQVSPTTSRKHNSSAFSFASPADSKTRPDVMDWLLKTKSGNPSKDLAIDFVEKSQGNFEFAIKNLNAGIKAAVKRHTTVRHLRETLKDVKSLRQQWENKSVAPVLSTGVRAKNTSTVRESEPVPIQAPVENRELVDSLQAHNQTRLDQRTRWLVNQLIANKGDFNRTRAVIIQKQRSANDEQSRSYDLYLKELSEFQKRWESGQFLPVTALDNQTIDNSVVEGELPIRQDTDARSQNPEVMELDINLTEDIWDFKEEDEFINRLEELLPREDEISSFNPPESSTSVPHSPSEPPAFHALPVLKASEVEEYLNAIEHSA